MASADINLCLALARSIYLVIDMAKKVGIILVNYKDYAERFLAPCRDSLRLQTYPPDLTQVYIVDNASSEQSYNYLASTYPEAKILKRDDGNYCAANNLGFQTAIKDGCEYLVTVNMDTEMSPAWLEELARVLDDEDVGIAQSKILLFSKNDSEKHEDKINTLGNSLHFLGFGTTSAYNTPDHDIKGYPEINGYASGCSFITRREVYQAIGGWNEEYYMYHDDIEFSLKARLAGYKIVLAPLSVIFHKYEFSRSVRMLYYMERNRYLLAFSFYPVSVIFLLLPAFIVMSLGLLGFSLIKGWFSAWCRSVFYFCRPSSWRLIVKTRRDIKNLRRQSFRIIMDDMAGKLEFSEIDNPLLRYVANPILSFYWRLIKKVTN